MKKAKIMLLTIAVVATVGSALAFKVQKMGDFKYCYAETTVEPVNCEQKVISSALAQSGSGIFYTDVTGVTNPDCTQLACPHSASSFAD